MATRHGICQRTAPAGYRADRVPVKCCPAFGAVIPETMAPFRALNHSVTLTARPPHRTLA